MKKFYVFLLSFFLFIPYSFSQSAVDATIRVTTTVSAVTPSITFSWSAVTGSTGITIYRKAKNATTWGAAKATLAGTATTYTDNTVVTGTDYEYRISSSGTITANTYIYAGINIPQVDNRGKLILLVDDSFITSLAAELTRLEADLVGDGWQVIRHNVSRTASPATVKDLIKTDYTADPANVKTVFIFGHVPVPYSGDINPDAHTDHKGAWPADGYYGDMSGTWTDNTVNNSTASRTENKNIPGDGKFDQSTLPSTLELQVGRVDLAKMTAFSTSTEEQLLKQYLNKDHNFRHKIINPVRRALIDDNFGWFSGEAFASSAWRSFASMFVPDSIKAGDYFTGMSSKSYLWSYGGGGGSYSSCSGVGNTTDFTNKSPQSVFTMLFGSYFGDWDSQNNFLRAPLASSGYGLTCSWSGRPYSLYHHMALGENIGYSIWLTMRNSTLYVSNYSSRAVSIALMGDPTLRMHIVAPPTNVVASGTTPRNIAWSASPDAVLGYHVYRQNNGAGAYAKITSSMVTGTSYSDASPASTSDKYMVKAVVLETSNSGSYYNLSQGAYNGIADNTAPAAPTNLMIAGLGKYGFTLNWTAAMDNVGVVSYEIFKNGVSVGTTTNTTFNIINLTANTTYAMTVKAKDAANNVSAASASLNVTTLAEDVQAPTVPTGLTASNIGGNSFTLKWTASTDNVGVASYEIFRNGNSIGTSATTSFAVSGLTSMTSYSMTVKAKDAAGNISSASAALNVTTIDNVAPSIPGNLTATDITSNSFKLTWTPSTDNVGVVSYEVVKAGVSLGTTTTTSFDVTGLTPATTYGMAVNAKDAAGNVSGAAAKAVTTEAGISLDDDLLNFSLFPNPAGNYVIIQTPGMMASMQLIDANGKLLEQRIITSSNEVLNLENYPCGVYWIRIITAGSVCNSKLIKQ